MRPPTSMWPRLARLLAASSWVALAGQSPAGRNLPALPDWPPLQQNEPWPDAIALLPLRPFDPGGASTKRVPFRWRGEKVVETVDSWSIEGGAIETEEVLLLADRIRYEPATGQLTAEGHIRLEAPDLRLRCDRLSMDWKHQVGEARGLELEIPPDWALRSDSVNFTTLKHWDFKAVELSPCPQEEPGWRARLSELKLDLDGFATLRHARVIVGHVPLLYVPWAIYPAKAQRSSGLLPPLLGYSGRLGATVGLSYFQTLGDSSDLTFSPQYFSKQGVLWGLESRWNPEPTHQGSFQGQFINERSSDERRSRFSFKEVWQREDGWQLTADINQASDSLIDADYGRGPGQLGTRPFDSAFYLGKSFQWASFAFTAQEQRSFFLPDDPFFRTDFPSSLKRQVLPQVEARLFPIPLGDFYLDGSWRTSRLSYKIQTGEDDPEGRYTWGRDDGFLRVHGRLGQWGPFRADAQLLARYTRYGATLKEAVFDPNSGASGTSLDPAINSAFDPFRAEGDSAKRYFDSIKVQLSGPQAGRTFTGLSAFGYHGDIRHVVEPFLALTQNSKFGLAGKLPRFDEVDAQPGVDGSAMGERSAEIGIKQHFLGRQGAGMDFADLVRFRLSIKYHFSPILLGDGRIKKGFDSLDSNIDVEPNEMIRLSFKRSSDLVDGGTDNSLSAEVKRRDGSHFNLAFFSTGINRFLVRQQGLQLGGMQRFLDDRVRLEFSTNYDIKSHGFTYSQVGLAYATPCVAATLRYSHIALSIPFETGPIGKEDRVDLVLTLRGLGDLFTLRQ
ncbi:MAG: LPS-assembly protein LptD [Holophagaceae bacterium]|nr:LPS-assembly protein LptD [Holophagaceae bacterium]